MNVEDIKIDLGNKKNANEFDILMAKLDKDREYLKKLKVVSAKFHDEIEIYGENFKWIKLHRYGKPKYNTYEVCTDKVITGVIDRYPWHVILKLLGLSEKYDYKSRKELELTEEDLIKINEYRIGNSKYEREKNMK